MPGLLVSDNSVKRCDSSRREEKDCNREIPSIAIAVLEVMLEFSTSVFQEPSVASFPGGEVMRKREENPLNPYQTENWCLLLTQVVIVKKNKKYPNSSLPLREQELNSFCEFSIILI